MKRLAGIALLCSSLCAPGTGCGTASNGSGRPIYPPELIRFDSPSLAGLKGYTVILQNEDPPPADPQTIYVVKGDRVPDTLVNAFSFVAGLGRLAAGDSNIVVYAADTQDSVYLVAIRLGDRPVADTLYAGRIYAPGNPIPRNVDVIGSMRDSVFYFHDWDGRGRRESFVWKLLPDRTWRKFLQLPGLLDWSIAQDFSEMLFCSDSSGQPQFPWGTLFRLDLSSDSLYRFTDLGSGIRLARCVSKDLPMLVLRISDTDGNIWAFRPGVGARRLTDVRSPEYVSWFLFYNDQLKYHVRSRLQPDYFEVGYLPLATVLADSLSIDK